jgi:dTDP-4-dehydrorhamnose 3,5-epimerase
MIEGVRTVQLQARADERGFLMELLRSDDEHFEKFGQAYASLNYPGVIRAWHWHERQSDLWVVVQGMVKAACFDIREESPTHGEVNEFFLGEQNRQMLIIPRRVAHGYKTVGSEPSLLVNFPTEPYDRGDPDEQRIPFDSPDIPYDWGIRIT